VSVLETELDALAAETAFSGVVHIDREDRFELAKAYGLAHRGYEIPNEIDTRFGTASATKGLTALAVVNLIEEGRLELTTTARSLLGGDLPLIDDRVTVEQLLAHRSGIGDYLDEEVEYDPNDYVLSVPVHELATTEDYLAVLDGHPTKFAPDERFGYCNGGYVVLALIAERVSGTPFHELVRERVCEPAGMDDTAFLRSDELPGRTAIGYLDLDGASRSNLLHLPVRGTGDGGVYTTAADVGRLWSAILAGRIVSSDWVDAMVQPRSDVPEESMRYGLGFWLHATTDAVLLVGGDAGVSFYSVHDPTSRLTYTVLSNTTRGAWPIARLLNERLADSG
jgi:CubicO group peptidase (beta-lactamase class C family)